MAQGARFKGPSVGWEGIADCNSEIFSVGYIVDIFIYCLDCRTIIADFRPALQILL